VRRVHVVLVSVLLAAIVIGFFIVVIGDKTTLPR
jgi:hypothetical protein